MSKSTRKSSDNLYRVVLILRFMCLLLGTSRKILGSWLPSASGLVLCMFVRVDLAGVYCYIVDHYWLPFYCVLMPTLTSREFHEDF